MQGRQVCLDSENKYQTSRFPGKRQGKVCFIDPIILFDEDSLFFLLGWAFQHVKNDQGFPT